MASFDIQPPDIKPQDWTRDSRAIPQPESITKADTSLGLTLSTLGEGLSSAVGIGKEIQEGIQKEAVRTGVEKLRDNYTAALTKVRDQQIAGVAPTAGTLAAAGIKPQTLGDEAEAEIPGGLQAGLDKAKTLGTAMAQNSGGIKANDTLYTGALNALAKNLRNQYPGSKDFIDEQIAKVSGKNPANAFYENLLQDINQGLNAGKSVVDKDHAFIDKYIDSIPGMELMRSKYDRGDANSQDLRNYVAQKSKLQIDQKAAEAARAALKSQGELTVQRVKSDFAKESGDVINDAWQTSREATNTKTPKEIVNYFNQQATGQIPYLGEDQNRDWLTTLASQKVAAAAQLRAIALRRDSEGNSYASNAGGIHNLKAEMDEQLSLYDNVISMVKDKDYKGVYYVLNQNNAMKNQATNELFKDSTVGEQTRRMSAVTEAVGPQTGSILLQDAIVGGLDSRYTAYVGGAKEHMLAQPDPNNPTGISDVLKDAGGKKIVDPNVYKSIIDVTKVIADPTVKDQAKINLATAAFSPKEIGSLNHFSNPADRQTAFMTMTDPKITDMMAKLPQKTQIEYRNWVEKTWGGILARDSIADLSKIKSQTFLQSYHISWDTKTNQFDLLNKDNTPLTDVQRSYARPALEPITKVNDGLRNLAHVEKSTGGDVNAYLVNVLSRSGFDFRNNVQGIPTKMMDALLNANRDPNKPKIDSTMKAPVSQ